MRIAVLAAPDSWYARDLQRAAGADYRVEPLPFTQLSSTLASGCSARVRSRGQSLEAMDAVLVRTMPPGSLEQVVFRMDALARYEHGGGLIVNPPRAIEAAVDKYLASARLAAAGLPIPRTCVAQNVDDAMAAFAELAGDAVIKPLFGSEGRGITRLRDESLARRAFQLLVQLGGVVYLQQFVPHHGHDYRLLVVGERVLGMKRANALDWRTNVSRGAVAEPLEMTSDLAAMARAATAAVGALIAGVDVLPGRDGQLYVLEVNAVPGWKALSQTLDVDVARLVLDDLAQRLAARDPRGASS